MFKKFSCVCNVESLFTCHIIVLLYIILLFLWGVGSWRSVVFSIVGRIFCNLSVASLQTLFSVNCPQVFPSVYLWTPNLTMHFSFLTINFLIQWKKVQIVLCPMHFSGPKHYYGLAVNPLDIKMYFYFKDFFCHISVQITRTWK